LPTTRYSSAATLIIETASKAEPVVNDPEVIDVPAPAIVAPSVLALEMGDVVQVVFTPGQVGDPIEKFAEIIAIDNNIDPTQHIIRFGFQTLDFASLVLDDEVFGKLDSGNALGF